MKFRESEQLEVLTVLTWNCTETVQKCFDIV